MICNLALEATGDPEVKESWAGRGGGIREKMRVGGGWRGARKERRRNGGTER